MVNEFKLAVVHFACSNPMQTCACTWINRWIKNGGKSGPGRGPPGRHGPSGRRAVARRWAAGLFLAKPAVVVFLLKFSRPFTNGIGCFMAFSLESSISFLMSIFRRNLTVLFFKFCCSFVVLVVSNFFALNMKQFEADNSVLFNLHFFCTILLNTRKSE